MIIRDRNGNIIPFGKTYKELSADFLDGTLPAWLETVGTVTFQPLPDKGTITVATAATAGASAELKMKSLIDSSKVTAIAVTVEGLQINGNQSISVQLGIKGTDSKSGVTFFHNVNTLKGAIRTYKPDGTYVDEPQNMVFHTSMGQAGDEAQNSKNLTLLLCTGSQFPAGSERPSAYLGSGDQWGGLTPSLAGIFTHGQLQCVLKITTSAAESKYVKVSKIKVGIWSN